MRPLAFALLVVVSFQSASAPADPQALQRMVASERAFAAATAEIGFRDGFLAFFADDSIKVQRQGGSVTLIPARADLIAQPLPKLPIVNQLIWEPFTGHISSDGTFGWLTGPFVLMNQAQKTTVGQGAYFSVWKRQPDGTYRVWLDEGIRLPNIWLKASPFRVAPDPDEGTAGAANEEIAEVERAVSTDTGAWRARLSADVRLHRDGAMPFVGREEVIAFAARQKRPPCTALRTEVAASGDLAVVIGACDLDDRTRGSYVRVWKRSLGGRWRIVFQTEADK